MWTADSLAQALTQELGAPVQVQFTRNRSTPVQAKAMGPGPFAKAGVHLSLHGFFKDAPPATVADLAHWLRVGRRARAACKRLDHWIQTRVADLPAKTPRRVRLRTNGEHHSLVPLMELVRQQEFQNAFSDTLPLPAITWSQQGTKSKLRTLRLGSYNKTSNLIRIHPVLDDPKAPEFFLRYIIFHELLHVVYPTFKGPGGRWVHHSKEFRRRESQYPDYGRALAWEQKDLWILARRRNKKKR